MVMTIDSECKRHTAPFQRSESLELLTQMDGSKISTPSTLFFIAYYAHSAVNQPETNCMNKGLPSKHERTQRQMLACTKMQCS